MGHDGRVGGMTLLSRKSTEIHADPTGTPRAPFVFEMGSQKGVDSGRPGSNRRLTLAR